MGKKSIIIISCLLMFMTMNVQAVDVLDVTVYRVYHIYTGAATQSDAFFMAYSTRNTIEKDGKNYCVYELSAVPSYCTEMPRTLLYRQDGKRIYRYDETRQTDVLMFDFSLETGDVFTTSQGKQMEVVGVSDCKEYMYDWLLWDYQENEDVMFNWNDYPEKKLLLRDCDNAAIEDVWIEGVGSLHTGILPPEFISNAEDCSLDFCDMGKCWAAFFAQNTPHYKSTQSVPFGGLDPEQPKYRNYSFSGDTLVISGCEVMGGYRFITSCFIHDNIVELSTYPLLLYGYDVIPDRGLWEYEIKIPGFLPGEYTIMAGGQKLASVVCVATSINTLQDTAKYPHSLYDLNGQRIKTLQKGLNIVDGKKIMVR